MAEGADEQGDGFEPSERVGSLFQDGVHGIGHGESVSPIVVGDAAVIFANRQTESGQRFDVKLGQSEEIDEHEDGTSHFLQVVHAELIEPKLVDVDRCVLDEWLGNDLVRKFACDHAERNQMSMNLFYSTK